MLRSIYRFEFATHKKLRFLAIKVGIFQLKCPINFAQIHRHEVDVIFGK